MEEKKKLWFKAKRYGYGWYPASWEGWAVLALYLFVMGGIIIQIGPDPQSHALPFKFFIEVMTATVLLIIICYKKGEKARWRWGNEN